ncbi:MAG: tripartite tricarboxylate transporter substrate binding protein [Candidatus Rokubacteria bacterium]|nr:tripartite tricarboxylate transporter substrate binding protein [Candidatus Rokubacteria bacterium]MBI2554820.1 tripartite tricarboxylate transporter substrate binding protein [Candidatus Rokubacteria bacterium]
MTIRLLIALVTLLGPGMVQAQETYPTRPITVVVPFPPGGIADLTARPLAPALERVLKQPVVVANKAGAAGAVGMQSVAIAKPDGYTLLIGLVSISIIPEVDALFARTPAYTRDQFVGIARLNADPPILVVGVETPWKSVKELVDDLKKRPGEVTYSSSGVYGASHVPMEMFLHAAGGLRMRHLPTTGGAPAMTAVLGGHAAMWASPPAVASPHLKAGKIRALATWGATRLAAFPDVPTMKELGHDVEYYLWAGLFAPKGVPTSVVKALRDATRQAVQDPEFRNAMEKVHTPIAHLGGDEFSAWWERDAQKLAGVIKRIGRIESK